MKRMQNEGRTQPIMSRSRKKKLTILNEDDGWFCFLKSKSWLRRFPRCDPLRPVFTLCPCVRTQTGQAGWTVQQETCRRKLHQRREQSPGLHGGQGIFTLGHDLQAVEREVIRRPFLLPLLLMPVMTVTFSLFLLFFFAAVRKDKKNSEEPPPPSAPHSKKPFSGGTGSHIWSACFDVNVFLKVSCFPM